MQQPEVHNDGIEALRLDRQRLRAALSEIDSRVAATGGGDHSGRHVDADHAGAAFRGRRGHPTGAGRHIKEAQTPTCVHGI